MTDRLTDITAVVSSRSLSLSWLRKQWQQPEGLRHCLYDTVLKVGYFLTNWLHKVLLVVFLANNILKLFLWQGKGVKTTFVYSPLSITTEQGIAGVHHPSKANSCGFWGVGLRDGIEQKYKLLVGRK